MTSPLTLLSASVSLLLGLVGMPPSGPSTGGSLLPEAGPSARLQERRAAGTVEAASRKRAPLYVALSDLRRAKVLPGGDAGDEPLATLKDVVVNASTGEVARYVVAPVSSLAAHDDEDGALARRTKPLAVEPETLSWVSQSEAGAVARSSLTPSRFDAQPDFDLAKLREELGRAAFEASQPRGRSRPTDDPAEQARRRDAIYAAGQVYRTAGGLMGLAVRASAGEEPTSGVASGPVVAKVGGLVLHLEGHRVAFASLDVDGEEVLVPWSKLRVETEELDGKRSTYLGFEGDPARLADAPRVGEGEDSTLDAPEFRATILRHFGVAPTERR